VKSQNCNAHVQQAQGEPLLETHPDPSPTTKKKAHRYEADSTVDDHRLGDIDQNKIGTGTQQPTN
jgi:hypothetical protein